jgi:hypothetical protein
VGIVVGMMQQRKAAKGVFYLPLTCCWQYAQYFIIIALESRHKI